MNDQEQPSADPDTNQQPGSNLPTAGDGMRHRKRHYALLILVFIIPGIVIIVSAYNVIGRKTYTPTYFYNANQTQRLKSKTYLLGLTKELNVSGQLNVSTTFEDYGCSSGRTGAWFGDQTQQEVYCTVAINAIFQDDQNELGDVQSLEKKIQAYHLDTGNSPLILDEVLEQGAGDSGFTANSQANPNPSVTSGTVFYGVKNTLSFNRLDFPPLAQDKLIRSYFDSLLATKVTTTGANSYLYGYTIIYQYYFDDTLCNKGNIVCKSGDTPNPLPSPAILN